MSYDSNNLGGEVDVVRRPGADLVRAPIALTDGDCVQREVENEDWGEDFVLKFAVQY